MQNIRQIIALFITGSMLVVGAILAGNTASVSSLIPTPAVSSQLSLAMGAPGAPSAPSSALGVGVVETGGVPDMTATGTETNVTTSGSPGTLPLPLPPPPPINSGAVLSGESGPSAAPVIVGPGNIQIINPDVESGRFIYYVQGCAGSYVPYGTGAPLPPPPPPPINNGSNLSGEGGPTAADTNGSNSNPAPASSPSVQGTGCAPWTSLITSVDGENIGGGGDTALYPCDSDGNKTSSATVTDWCEQVYFSTGGFTGTGQHQVSVGISSENGINSSASIETAFNNPPPPPSNNNVTQQTSAGIGTLNVRIDNGDMYVYGPEIGYLGHSIRIINLYAGTYILYALSQSDQSVCYYNNITIYANETTKVTASGPNCE